jgi:hypothetical protein
MLIRLFLHVSFPGTTSQNSYLTHDSTMAAQQPVVPLHRSVCQRSIRKHADVHACLTINVSVDHAVARKIARIRGNLLHNTIQLYTTQHTHCIRYISQPSSEMNNAIHKHCSITKTNVKNSVQTKQASKTRSEQISPLTDIPCPVHNLTIEDETAA